MLKIVIADMAAVSVRRTLGPSVSDLALPDVPVQVQNRAILLEPIQRVCFCSTISSLESANPKTLVRAKIQC